MGTCQKCNEESNTISEMIGFCADCIKADFSNIWPEIKKLHHHSRYAHGLPEEPPQSRKGIPCPYCVCECRIPEGEIGYCGIRKAEGGELRGGTPDGGNLYYYYDSIPTNCVASFVCAAGTGCGYPRYANVKGPEYGLKNLSVFYHACSFNCLFCQNHQFKEETFKSSDISAKELALAADDTTSCICYFGGDPAPQILHALEASKRARKYADGRIMRICWETNGAVREPFLSEMADLSLESGGCVKFDLKAWNEGLHYALCGITNRKTLDNFKKLAERVGERPNPPFLVVSTLLVPGYIDETEVAALARFIADIDPNIPYSLLAFYPHYYIKDLPVTSRTHALRCLNAAKDAGLQRVHIGNLELLGDDY